MSDISGRSDDFSLGQPSDDPLDQLYRTEQGFVAESVRALRRAVYAVGGHEGDPLFPGAWELLNDRWDVVQNEAEVAFQERDPYEDEPDGTTRRNYGSVSYSRWLLDATYDRAWRDALQTWTVQNPHLLSDAPPVWPRAFHHAASLDLTNYRNVLAHDSAAQASLATRQLPCSADLCMAAPKLAELAMSVWRVASTTSPMSEGILHNRPYDELQPALTVEGTAPVGSMQAAASAVAPLVREGTRPQVGGDILEAGMLDVLEFLFDIDETNSHRIREELRRQRAGTQYGTDIVVRAKALGARSTCLVECKNYSTPIRTGDIADKLLQAEASFDNEPVDHWILVSPHTDPANELDLLIQRWNSLKRFPFTVQVWSPQNHVRDLLRLVPQAYLAIYGERPGNIRDGEAREIVARFTELLRPPLRVPDPVARHVSDIRTLLQPNESAWLALLEDHVPRRGFDETGARLTRPLPDEISNVLFQSGGRQRVALLLADFGEGKSFFTVAYCKQLRDSFIADPLPTTPIPIRLLLRGFRHVSSPHDFLRAQLESFGINQSTWADLIRHWTVLVVLDGMDEMSVRQDAATTRSNLEHIAGLLEALEGLPVLVTSRPHFFSSAPDRERFYDRLRRPHVYRLAQPDRRETVSHLRTFAEKRGLAPKLDAVKDLYDPIGLAGKVLFLEMIKDTLADLPEDHFDERTLYETYIRSSLSRKVELLRDPGSSLRDADLLEQLELLLEKLAVAIHIGGEGSVDLRELFDGDGGAAQALWKTSEQSDWSGYDSSEDASVRIGGRSLLRRAQPGAAAGSDEGWTVDFFHRSMKEYFVAKALRRALDTLDSFGATRALLVEAPVQPEIARFFGLMDVDVPKIHGVLSDLIHSARRRGQQGMLGGGAASLFHASRGSFSGESWRDLCLDGALLRRADLRGVDLHGSTLRGADLSSADLREADLSGCDLSGANLDVTEAIVDVASGSAPGQYFCLTSEAGIGRLAVAKDGELHYSQPLRQGSLRWPRRLSVISEDTIIVAGDAEVAILEGSADAMTEVCSFRVSNRIRQCQLTSAGELGLVVEDGPRTWSALLVDLTVPRILWRSTVAAELVTCQWYRDWFVAGYPFRIEIHRRSSGTVETRQLEDELGAFDVDSQGNGLRLLVASTIGSLYVLESMSENGVSLPVHSGSGTAIVASADQILSAGSDGSLALVDRSQETDYTVTSRLDRHLRCTGAGVKDLCGAREQRLLLANGAVAES